MNKKQILKLLASIALCQLAGIIGGFFTASSVSTWYASLIKPFFNPPNFLFGPVWITLYTLMGISLYLVLETSFDKKAISVFAVQLFLNSIWSIGFFGFQSTFLGLIIIIPLWFAILYTILLFRKISKTSAYLLIPYIIWVSFAACLNYALLVLNAPGFT
jgi:tryptophan-rich sensory protein